MIANVLRFGHPAQVSNGVVGANAITVFSLEALRTWTVKVFEDEAMHGRLWDYVRGKLQKKMSR